MFRSFLIEIRKRYGEDKKKFYIFMTSLIALLVSISLILDYFLPFSGIANFGRALLLTPLSLSIFILGYAISLKLHADKKEEDDDWVPYRLRFSVTWRRRISAIIGAILFVFMYANTERVGYTLTASLLVSVIIALLAFMRPTRKEIVRQTLKIPDVRDIKYERHKEALQAARKEEEAALKEARKAKRRGYRKIHDDPEEQKSKESTE